MLEDCAHVAEDGFEGLGRLSVAFGCVVAGLYVDYVAEDFCVCERGEARVEDLGCQSRGMRGENGVGVPSLCEGGERMDWSRTRGIFVRVRETDIEVDGV